MWLFMHVFWMLYSATVSNELVCNPWLHFSSEITSMSGWSMFRRWCLSIRHFCTCQHSSLLKALSQASSHFNVDVQKLLFICFVLILVRIGLVGLVGGFQATFLKLGCSKLVTVVLRIHCQQSETCSSTPQPRSPGEIGHCLPGTQAPKLQMDMDKPGIRVLR